MAEVPTARELLEQMHTLLQEEINWIQGIEVTTADKNGEYPSTLPEPVKAMCLVGSARVAMAEQIVYSGVFDKILFEDLEQPVSWNKVKKTVATLDGDFVYLVGACPASEEWNLPWNSPVRQAMAKVTEFLYRAIKQDHPKFVQGYDFDPVTCNECSIDYWGAHDHSAELHELYHKVGIVTIYNDEIDRTHTEVLNTITTAIKFAIEDEGK